VHAAAVIKALKKGDNWLADRVYSSVPAGLLGLRQEIEIGPMCGESNVIYWLTARGYEAERGLVEHLFRLAKQGEAVLTEAEILASIRAYKGSGKAVARG